MQTLYWNLDTRVVSTQPFSRTPAQVSNVRGGEEITLVAVQGTGQPVPVLLDAGGIVGIIVRNPVNLKAGCLAGPSPLTRGASAAAGYTGTTSTDTTLTRAQMRVDPADSSTELENLPAEAVFYFAPANNGTPLESAPFSWNVLPNYYRPLESVADVVDPAAVRLALGLGNAATCDVGTAPGDVVALGTDGKLPALDGSKLTNLPASGGALPASLTGLVYSTAGAPSAATPAQVCALVTGAINPTRVTTGNSGDGGVSFGNSLIHDQYGFGRIYLDCNGAHIAQAINDSGMQGLMVHHLILDGPDGNATISLSKLGPGIAGVGNGTSGDASGALQLGDLNASGTLECGGGNAGCDPSGNFFALSYNGDGAGLTGYAPSLAVASADVCTSAAGADTCAQGTDAGSFFGIPTAATPTTVAEIAAILRALNLCS